MRQIEYPCAWMETSSAGHRLVADEELRRHRERTGDPDALALPAGELVRVAALQRGVEADPQHHFVEPGRPSSSRRQMP